MLHLANMWVDLDSVQKKEWTKLSKEAFAARRINEAPQTKAVVKKKKTTKSRADRIEGLPEIKALVLQLLEDADLQKTSVTDVRTQLGKLCDPKVLDDNKSEIRKYITIAVKEIQQR
jgi:hypothetical protein